MDIQINKNNAPYFLLEVFKKKFSGSMQVDRGKLKKRIYFERGMPVGSRSNLLNECLGRIFVSSGVVSLEDCERSLKVMKTDKVLQGEALIKLGVLDEQALANQLRDQLKMRLINLFGWNGARFSFNDGDVQKYTSVDEGLNQIVFEGARKNHEMIVKEFSSFSGNFFQKTNSYQSVLKNLGYENVPFVMAGKKVDDIMNSGMEALAYTYMFLMAGALKVGADSEDKVKLLKFYESIKDKNHFEVLGVIRGAGTKDVKQAYKKLAKLYHPDFFDRHSDESIKNLAKETFPLVSEAYAVLMDEKKRAEYENKLDKGTLNADVDTGRVILADMEFKKGQNMLRFGNFADARECFQKAVDYYAEDAESFAYLGWCIFNSPGRSKEEAEEAKEYINKSISMNKQLAEPHYFFGVILRAEGDFEGALSRQNKALKLDKNLMGAQSEIRLVNKRIQESKGIFQKLFRK
ncbi:MAG: DnaJ domain-containing protein [Deltaproteobacteria bacterium]|nr:DnaJ domain-containing protein [Deltaproteobacteria bacterium]